MIFKNGKKIKYKDEDLFEQNVYNLKIEDTYGMISYKNIYLNEENIGYNELPMISLDKDNNSTSSDSINKFDDEEALMIIRQKTKIQRNSTLNMVELMKNTNRSKSMLSRQLTKKSTLREKSADTKCFEFEDSDDYSSDDDKKKKK